MCVALSFAFRYIDGIHMKMHNEPYPIDIKNVRASESLGGIGSCKITCSHCQYKHNWNSKCLCLIQFYCSYHINASAR